MKKFIKYLPLFFSCAFTAQAQDVNININTLPASMSVGQSGYVQVVLCNLDPNPINAPSNKLRPQISAPPYSTITGVSDMNGNPLSDFTILSMGTGSGNTIILRYNNILANANCVSFRVNFVSTAAGSNSVFTSTLGFSGPQTNGNDPGNDNSASGLLVTTPLPIGLTAFQAEKLGLQSLLKWNTATELSNAGFNIERSADGKTFSKIGMVTSKAPGGKSDTRLEYSFKDANPLQGVNYYRLCQIDKDGKVAYSHIEEIAFGNKNGVKIYPNPTSTNVIITGLNAGSTIRIVDLTGKVVLTPSVQDGSAHVDLESLSKNIYLVQVIENGTIVYTEKVIKK